ncbi:Dynein heavy chain, coiled coil stalk [Kalmanozyma brasiliensis GHG001]|uniref:Dynein heavy chain, cytoplasmic n=1 Tax=Kalmanozyma brasiliensis (strain GHG001) TaxID=1365824 RepID=V5GTU2_KALBG|nr:Dynein heavy chain, coiled coil stalk [Kalmanozyma brasiliensis GHG001]EST09332.1 Dynein heavy chain, coiled coil stalk [Kalmanozyma brasiliensis GHG001]
MDAVHVDGARKAPGDWSPDACRTVAAELTNTLDLGANRQLVVEALVFIHFSVYTFAERLRRRQGRRYHQSPRHFLSFIEYYVQVSNQKRDELEDQQRFLLVGLDKLRSTVDQVEELQKSLAVKRTQLEAKNAQANQKLQSMVKDQQEAEQKRAASIEIQAALADQEQEIGQRRQVVMADLADAEPAVQDAQASVSNIKKQHLTEVRSMGNPPLPVKNAMESVCIILGHKIESWKTVQAIIRRDDFIASIVNFDTDRQMTRQIREKMIRDYLSKPGYDFATINRASQACGPLAKWVIAQVRFSEILDKVGPLRDEVQSLEQQAEDTKLQAGEIVNMIAELENSIATYKDEYAALISETQAIKSEMERVQNRVSRSMQLLDSLSSEKQRWETGSRTFDDQMSTIIGDALLSAAMLAYAGYFDQQYRESMWQYWSDHLRQAEIKFKPELSFADYLSTADERLEWQAKSLPADTLCTENAIMLKRWNRYPLIIDPSGQAVNFLLNEYKVQKLTVTSFLDEAFLKALESSLRFGNPLLIQDVEYLDPILNPVLNKELRRTGGRVLIRLGSQDIDFSPSFNMFLTTRDPSVEFSPDICSRVTFVNFTMTRGSLQSQSLDQVLKVERPDTDRKRTDLMKLQGEFRLRLRHLERSLLTALNESEGNILDDDKVIDTLETLKKEAAEVTSKVEETDAIMQEVDQVTAQYVPLAKACSSVFFVLDQLHLISHFYQFSLRFFLDIFDYVLRRNPHLEGVTDPKQRLDILMRDLFLVVFHRTSKALAHHDHVMLAMLLAQIKAREEGHTDTLDSDEYEFLLEGGNVAGAAASTSGAAGDSNTQRRGDGEVEAMLDEEQLARVQVFKRLAFFRTIEEHMEANTDKWLAFLNSNNPETSVPVFWSEDEQQDEDLADQVRKMLVVKCLRPDRIVQAMAAFASRIFGQDVLGDPGYELGRIVAEEVDASTPVALCSVPGYDASYRVDHLVKLVGARCTPVAMGSQEGFALADHAITSAARTGNWVLLKNVHLAPSWLSQLEKKMHGLNPNRNFRLFLTCETSPSIPVNFLRASRILMNEPPPGIRASMLDSLKSIAPGRLQRGPAETPRLYFLLAFFHATLTERLRYTPLGWSKPFEFNDSDAEAALDIIEGWVAQVAKGRANVDPQQLPWDAIRSLLKQSVYGGKIDNNPDQTLLDSFVDELFCAQAYDVDFQLVKDDKDPLVAPEGTKIETFVSWVQALPEQQPPQWLALPPSAEKVIAAAQGTALLSKLVRMKQLADDDDDETIGQSTGGSSSSAAKETASSTAASSSSSVQPSWMKALRANAMQWLDLLPSTVSSFGKDAGSVQDPLYRFWAREHRTGSSLLSTVRKDLLEVVAVCDGNSRQTNHNRALLTDLPKAVIPQSWRRYAVPKAMTLPEWIVDLRARLEQLERITREAAEVGGASGGGYDMVEVILGLLFSPGAYLTATRQSVAHASKVSLENLSLKLLLNDPKAGLDAGKFAIRGLKLQGANWDAESKKIRLNDGAVTNLGLTALVWDKQADSQKDQAQQGKVLISVYLNQDRSQALFATLLDVDAGVKAATVAQRAVALRAA